MNHRHLDSEWTAAAIDSVLEYGDLPDWRELFAAVRDNPELAHRVSDVARRHPLGGASALAIHLCNVCLAGRHEEPVETPRSNAT